MQYAEIIASCGKKVAQGLLVREIAIKDGYMLRQSIDERVTVLDERKNTAAVCQKKLNHGASEKAGGTGDQVILIHHTSSFGNPTDVDYLS